MDISRIPPYQGQYEKLFRDEARAYLLDWTVLVAQVSFETGHTFDPKTEGDFDAEGKPRALGLGQFWKATWGQVWGRWVEYMPWKECALCPEFAIPAQAKYLDWIQHTIVKSGKLPADNPPGSLTRLGLGSYNWGIGNTLRALEKYPAWDVAIWAEFPEITQRYITGIMALSERIRSRQN